MAGTKYAHPVYEKPGAGSPSNLADEQLSADRHPVAPGAIAMSGEDQGAHARGVAMPDPPSCPAKTRPRSWRQPEGKAKLAQEVQKAESTTYLV